MTCNGTILFSFLNGSDKEDNEFNDSKLAYGKNPALGESPYAVLFIQPWENAYVPDTTSRA